MLSTPSHSHPPPRSYNMTTATYTLSESPRDHLARLAVRHTVESILAKAAIPTKGTIPQVTPVFGDGVYGMAKAVELELPPLLSAEPILPQVREEKLPIGIIGAGAAGLCAAMMLQDLGIDYEILEAEVAEKDGGHLGGRIWTHRFNGQEGVDAPFNDPKRYDYIDMGAMRYPDIPTQKPTFAR